MAELLERGKKKWTVRCPCGALVRYTKQDVYKRDSTSALSSIIRIKLDMIRCPECGKEIQVYFTNFNLN